MLDARVEAAGEFLELVEHSEVPRDIEALALFGAAGVDWERGDIHRAQERITRARTIAAALGSPALITQLDFFQVSVQLWRGKFAAADQLIDTAYDLYRRTRRWAADQFRAGFKTLAWMEQGRLDEIDAAAPSLLDGAYRPWFREVYAYALAHYGRLDDAAEVLEDELPPLFDCWLTPGIFVGAAHTRVVLGDVAGATTLREQLAPYAGRNGTVGTGPSFGDVDLALAEIAHLVGDDAAARRHIDASIAFTERTGGEPWLARGLLLRAELAGPEADRDRSRAAEIIDRLHLESLQHRR
jgi:hypothetical protein